MKTTKRIVSFALAAMLLVSAFCMTSAVVASAKIVPNSLAVSLEEAGENPNIASRSPLMNRLLQGIDSAKKSITTLTSSVANSEGGMWNVSYEATEWNLSKGSLTEGRNVFNQFDTVYVNNSFPGTARLKEFRFYVKTPGSSSFALIGKETADRYICWSNCQYTFSQSGTYRFRVEADETDGSGTWYGEKDVTVYPSSQPAPTPAPSSYDQKVNAFLADSRFAPGTSWGGSQGPKISSWGSSGCCSFAVDFIAYVHGITSNPWGNAAQYSSPSDIRSGDVIWFNPTHYVVVLYRNGSQLTTVEGNWNSVVTYSTTAYTIVNGTVYRNGSPFRTFACGFHY